MIRDFLLDLFFPKFCLNCGKNVSSYLCDSCFKKIKFIEKDLCPVCERQSLLGATHPGCCGKYVIDGIIVGADYHDPIVRNLIHQFKYQNATAAADCIIDKFILPKFCRGAARLAARQVPAHSGGCPPPLQLITYIPLHLDKERKRGFNQSEILARVIGQRLNLPVVPLLKRTIYTAPQMEIEKAEERRKNVKKIFQISVGAEHVQPLHEKTIGLVDDVATTGATLFEAVRVLKHHGAGKVWGIVVAREQRN